MKSLTQRVHGSVRGYKARVPPRGSATGPEVLEPWNRRQPDSIGRRLKFLAETPPLRERHGHDAGRRFAGAAGMRRCSAARKHRPSGGPRGRGASCGAVRKEGAVAWSAPSPEPPQETPRELSQSRRAAGQWPADLLGLWREAAWI